MAYIFPCPVLPVHSSLPPLWSENRWSGERNVNFCQLARRRIRMRLFLVGKGSRDWWGWVWFTADSETELQRKHPAFVLFNKEQQHQASRGVTYTHCMILISIDAASWPASRSGYHDSRMIGSRNTPFPSNMTLWHPGRGIDVPRWSLTTLTRDPQGSRQPVTRVGAPVSGVWDAAWSRGRRTRWLTLKGSRSQIWSRKHLVY